MRNRTLQTRCKRAELIRVYNPYTGDGSVLQIYNNPHIYMSIMIHEDERNFPRLPIIYSNFW